MSNNSTALQLIMELAEGKYTTLQLALAYARARIKVFPVLPGGKKPAIANGYLGASTDPETIKAWFGNPDFGFNIGLVPGTGNWLVIDVDVKSGGFQSLAALNLPHTIMVRTGSGGLHLWYRVPEHKFAALLRHGGSSNGRVAKGIDTRFSSGYVVSPPSKTNGAYVWMLPGIPKAAND
jgi:putative DNA primase/helicase